MIVLFQGCGRELGYNVIDPNVEDRGRILDVFYDNFHVP